MALSDDDVREILRLIDESDLDELRIETEGLSLHVRRGGAPPPEAGPTLAPPAAEEAAVVEEPTAAESNGAAPAGAETIVAPMIGTFYRAEAPGRPPYVDVGAEVEPGTVVGLIEVMKMMNSIRAGVSGTVVEVCAENGAMVEADAPLFRVEPAG